ncbi:MAG: family 78 glycoside hydrolase catalytic domain [Lentisphaeria bacterium]
MTDFSKKAQWIWLEKDVFKIHQYACFRRTFDLKEPAQGRLLVSANWNFIAYLNGKEVGQGQFPDYPEQKTYTELKLNDLRAGKNVLAFLVYNTGEDFFATLKAPGGLLVQLCLDDQEILTDETWKCHLHHAFYSGRMPKMTSQLGFTTQYDARKEEDWTALDYDDSHWGFATVNSSYKPTLTMRPLPPISLGERAESTIVKTGWFCRKNESGTFAEMVSSDSYDFVPMESFLQNNELSKIPANKNGAVLIADLAKEQVGFIEIELIAEEGTIVDISHGEHLEDCIVRASVGGRNFTDRFICRKGKNSYQLPFRRMGGRYLQLNLTHVSGTVKIVYIGLRKWDLPLSKAASFECDFPIAAKLREVGLRTMRMCMHDHYEDCPWREQGLYAYDSRNQMMFGYYAWGNYRFAETSLDLLGHGFTPKDGHLNLCAPTHRSVIIPIFSYVWVSALYENYLYSGEDRLLHKFATQLQIMTNQALALKDPKTGLIEIPDPEKYWNFCEWVPGLDGSINGGVKEHPPLTHEIQAPQNLYIYEMLSSYIKIMHALGNLSEVERMTPIRDTLGKAIENYFWNEKEGCYWTRQQPGFHLHKHIQYLMLAFDLVPESKKARVFSALRSTKLTELTFSPLLYQMNGLLKQSSTEQEYAVKKINDVYKKMLNKGATTFWETEDGASAFSDAGSLCHAWSSIHIYYYGAFVLGVRPLTAGFKKFEVKPYAGKLNYAKGTVPTPAGNIQIEWRKTPQNTLIVSVQYPTGLTPKIVSYPDCPVTEIHSNEY